MCRRLRKCTELLDRTEKAPDQPALLVRYPCRGDRLRSGAERCHNSRSSLDVDRDADAVAGGALPASGFLKSKPSLKAWNRCRRGPDRPSEQSAVDCRAHRHGVDLGCRDRRANDDRLGIKAPFLGPAGCESIRTTVASMMGYSQSGLSHGALKMRSRTPDRLSKALGLALRLSNWGGRPRQGAPVRLVPNGIDEQAMVHAVPCLLPVRSGRSIRDALPLRVWQIALNRALPTSCQVGSSIASRAIP
jgi:hypothetical protein